MLFPPFRNGPPVAACHAGSAGDPHFASVVFLSGFEGVDTSTTFDDESNANHTLTANGDAQVDTAQFKAGTSSVLLGGTGFVSAADHANWQFTGEFTIEGFMRVPAGIANGSYVMISQYGAAGARAWRMFWTKASGSRTMTCTVSSDGSTQSPNASSGDIDATLVDDTWLHWAADRDSSNVLRVYLEGTMVGSTTGVTGTFDSGSQMRVGADQTLFFNGWLDEVRITKGVARYATDTSFAVPPAPFPRS